MIEEAEQQTLPPIVEKDNVEATQSGSPLGISSSPSYAEMTKKKPPGNLWILGRRDF
jgi:hypothetical protein